MNKTFTAVATLQLVEAGKLALDDTIVKHLPGYPNKDVASKRASWNSDLGFGLITAVRVVGAPGRA